MRVLTIFLMPLSLASFMHQAAIAQPVLAVNRDTGAVAITNPTGTGIPLDGYTIQSTIGSLSLANWMSLEDNPGVAGTGWFEANPSNNRLSELRSSGTSTLAAAGSWGLGNVFQPPAPTQFGQNLEDLVFQFNDPVAQATVNGMVNYTGTANINNLVLFADPATGNVKIRNTSPFSVAIDGYTIISMAGSLNSNAALWTSLQDQPGVAPNWFEANLSDFRVSEVMSSGTTTLTGNSATTFDLGGLFKPAGTRDLVFQFLLAGNSLPNTGVVLYAAAPPIDGLAADFNNDGSVDAADLAVWRGAFATGSGADADGDGDSDGADFLTWQRQLGSGPPLTPVSAAVPEPNSLLLLALAFLPVIAKRR